MLVLASLGFNNWRNSCLAFVENNSENCIYFDELGTNHYSSENCFWDFGIYINDSYCDEISGSRKYFCKAIANDDEKYCMYMDTEDSELSCINFLKSTESNRIVGDDIDEYMKNKDKIVFNEIEDCLLLKDVERRICLIDFALSSNDLSVCNEVNEKRRDNCFDKFGMFLNISACFESSNLYEAESCVFSAITSMDRTNQKINPKICDEFNDKNTRNDCYLRYAMMRFRS